MVDELFVGMRSVPGARQELCPPRSPDRAPAFCMPLFAGVLVIADPALDAPRRRRCDPGGLCHFCSDGAVGRMSLGKDTTRHNFVQGSERDICLQPDIYLTTEESTWRQYGAYHREHEIARKTRATWGSPRVWRR